MEGYYVRPIPAGCRAHHLGNWRPTFRIKEPWTECKVGWRKFKTSCYKQLPYRGRGMDFRSGEQACNRNQGHIFVPKDRVEFMWVHDNVARHNKWYWIGIFCGHGANLRNAYTVTGEDMRKRELGFKGNPRLNMHTWTCFLWLRNNKHWIRHLNIQNCKGPYGVICESPLG